MSAQKDTVPDLMDFTVQLAYKNLMLLLVKKMKKENRKNNKEENHIASK